MSRDLPVAIDSQAELSLAAQISQQIGWLITAGTIEAGDELPSIQQMADHLNVNIHTVRAGYQRLEAQGFVSLARGRKARVLGFDRTRHAAKTSRVPSHTIGVVIPEFVQLYGPMLSAIEAAAFRRPSLVFVATAHENPDTTLSYIDRLISHNVDGIIVAAPLIDAAIEFPDNGPPIVYIDAPGSPGISIEFDLERSQHLATRHLIEHGHTTIGYITPPVELRNVAAKLQGHTRALIEAGIEPTPRYTVETDGFDIAAGRTAAHRMLTMINPPTAITTASDALAVGAYQAANDLGVHIPNDLAITSNDNSELATVVNPELTTVTAPVERAGHLAIQAIHDTIDNKRFPQRTVLDVDLVIRNSCGCQTAKHQKGT
jgi:DNA-binding LacI/PurR family transcriptional regulator